MTRSLVSHSHYFWPMALLVCHCLSSGCSRQDTSHVRAGWVLAEGNVSLDEKPLDDAKISFVPASLKNLKDQEQWFTAAILKGRFKVELPLGDYKVRIQKYREGPGYISIPTIPKQFNESTVLTAKVTEATFNDLSFNLDQSEDD
ncbi:hypothetical protein [Bremerella alba]|uniref:Lipoprotein n=1 Tax=Bremerella alba TaxID=980252 RepID=A0A7V8V394_9BACT|nr:hypothetical protein [Bremerella alba]MBA2114119.1 hypothetical protein [Bremerella alba]